MRKILATIIITGIVGAVAAYGAVVLEVGRGAFSLLDAATARPEYQLIYGVSESNTVERTKDSGLFIGIAALLVGMGAAYGTWGQVLKDDLGFLGAGAGAAGWILTRSAIGYLGMNSLPEILLNAAIWSIIAVLLLLLLIGVKISFARMTP